MSHPARYTIDKLIRSTTKVYKRSPGLKTGCRGDGGVHSLGQILSIIGRRTRSVYLAAKVVFGYETVAKMGTIISIDYESMGSHEIIIYIYTSVC